MKHLSKEVSFPLAKLLKEKGFDKETNDYFLEDGIEYSYPKKENWNLKTDTISQPTIAEVIDWLYKKHKIWISCPFDDGTLRFYYVINTSTVRIYANRINSLPVKFNSPEEACEAAIEHTLKELI